MTTLIDQRDVLVNDMLAIEQKARDEDRELTAEEADTVLAKATELDEVKGKIAKGESAREKLAGISAPKPPTGEAKTLGEHFAKYAGDQLRKSGRTIAVSAPEFKAATDVHMVTSSNGGAALVDVDKTVVTAFRQRPTVASLLSAGQMTGTSLTYFVEGTREGAYATVAENARKPQMHYNYTSQTDGLAKIAGFVKESDEMVKDLPFLVSAINNRLLYDLAMFEEAQILAGDGAGTNLRGLLNRSGIQTETEAATGDSPQDAIFRAMTKVQTGTGLVADGIIINPADYQELRLSKDGNGQYFGGGFFTGQYGNGGVVAQPNLWGVPTVITTAVPAKTVVVGALRQAATLYRKDGIEVEATNTNEDDFVHNRVTIRAEERVGLAVRVPAAIVRVTLAA